MNRTATIYTDGSCHGNPGPGGYAAVVIYNGTTLEAHGSLWQTTNNRMELTAVIQGLKLLPEPCNAHIISDSQYVVKPIKGGNLRGYTNTPNRVNADLWAQILRLSTIHKLTAEWVKGHAGNRLNQRCDSLANNEAKRVEHEKAIRLFVFRELIGNIMASPEQIAAHSGFDIDVIRKYHGQFFEQYNAISNGER